MSYTSKSWMESGNRTRGQYGCKPVMHRVSWDPETNGWIEDANGESWGAFDPDFGWMAPWPDADVVEDTEPEWRLGPVGWEVA